MPKDTPQFRLPNSTQRIAIVGRTGSGKTLAGLWHLSNSPFDSMPWVIVDYKTDDHIALIDRAQYIDTKFLPKNPGIYIIQPEPDDESMRDFLTNIWRRGGIGVYVDEGYMIGENKKVEQRFKTLLTQGRSKHIPMIVLSQRPVWISRFVWSESDFYQVFDIATEDDIESIERMLPKNSFHRMPDYHSLYYDVSKRHLTYLAPVPAEDQIIDKINARLKPIRKRI